MDDGINKNAELASAILHSGLQSFGIPRSKDDKSSHDWQGTATSSDLEKARSTLRQFYRDWSAEGAAEREACYGPVIRALQRERQTRLGSKLRVLVPGAGLGRLVFELCYNGFDAEGNEISFHQLLASQYILNICPERNYHSLFPWIHSFSNHNSRSNHLRSVQIPDLHPGTTLGGVVTAGEMSMSASDFLLLYGNEEQRDKFDAVATVFFLDTAPNIIRYIEAIRNCLRTGGLLINVGPLLWHFENNAPGRHGHEGDSSPGKEAEGQSSPCLFKLLMILNKLGIADPGSVELTDDEVIALVAKLGFEIEYKESGIAAPYIQDPTSMLQNTYKASHWVARRK